MISALLVLFLLPNVAAREAEDLANKALAAGDHAEALAQYEAALRAADSTPDKARLRDLYIRAGWAEPRPMSDIERRIIQLHIRNEKARLFTRAAENFEKADRLHAAIIMRRVLIELFGGAQTKRGKQETGRIRRIVRKLTENPSAEDRAFVKEQIAKHKSGPALLKLARKLIDAARYRAAVRLCQELMVGRLDQKTKNAALALRKDAERRASAQVPASEKKAALEVITDERFERLAVTRSRHFLFLGPQAFVESIPKKQRTLLDLAYIIQSDLAAQDITGDGVRICLYYQETFDFGGGLAGGKLIRIGNRAIRLPVAGFLHYHELGHCIFGRGWLHRGFTEGLADFAAGFSLDALGRTGAAAGFILNAREQFVRYFLGRQMRYFRVQPYRPAAGFLFSFLPPGEAPYDWTPYRHAFRLMREAQFGSWPVRDHQLMRYFGYLMAQEYGLEVYDTLAAWGWPVNRADMTRVPQEAEDLLPRVKQGEYRLAKGDPAGAEAEFRAVVAEEPDGWIACRARYGLLRVALALNDPDRAARLRTELGILDRYRVLGPFHARGRTAHVVFPPETGKGLRAPSVRFGFETAIWREAKVREDGYVDLRGQGFGYPENACAFALVYLYADRPQPARIYLGSDDGHTLYLDGKLIEKRATSRTFRFDDDFSDVRLRSGWNRLLVKVHNRSGAWGFLMRITRRDLTPLPGLRLSTKVMEDEFREPPERKLRGFQIVADEFKGLSGSRWRTTVGRFDTQNGFLRPMETAKRGLWQRFKVDPDKPKDGPANIVWLKSSDLARADDFDLALTLAAGPDQALPARFGITIDGENENDGQSGHTLVFDEADKKLRCNWYRYDRLLYLQPGVAIEPAASYLLHVRRIGSKWWIEVNGTPLFEKVDAPRLPAFGFGILAWGKAPLFDAVKLVRLVAPQG